MEEAERARARGGVAGVVGVRRAVGEMLDVEVDIEFG